VFTESMLVILNGNAKSDQNKHNEVVNIILFIFICIEEFFKNTDKYSLYDLQDIPHPIHFNPY
jgi:hypothetical protein